MKKVIVICMVVFCIVMINSYIYAEDIFRPDSMKPNGTGIGDSFQNIGGIVIGILQVIRSSNSCSYVNYISN